MDELMKAHREVALLKLALAQAIDYAGIYVGAELGLHRSSQTEIFRLGKQEYPELVAYLEGSL